MDSTTPSVSFPVRWSSFITIETREPRLILARSVPVILGNLFFLLLCCMEFVSFFNDLHKQYIYLLILLLTLFLVFLNPLHLVQNITNMFLE